MKFVFIEKPGEKGQIKTRVDTDAAHAYRMLQYLCNEAFGRAADFEVMFVHE